jgi:hypothetical protein
VAHTASRCLSIVYLYTHQSRRATPYRNSAPHVARCISASVGSRALQHGRTASGRHPGLPRSLRVLIFIAQHLRVHFVFRNVGCVRASLIPGYGCVLP